MYLKLSWRNALRSAHDYLIYMATLTILTAIMTLSNLVAALGARAGFDTAALPALVTFAMAVLIHHASRFALRQRAKELATYLLMGMERRELAWLYFLECFLLGVPCFVCGALLGTALGLGAACFSSGLSNGGALAARSVLRAMAASGCSFFLIEVLTLAGIRRIILQLEIRELLEEKRRNLELSRGKTRKWTIMAGISFLLLMTALTGIVFLPEEDGMPLLSLISLPLLVLFFSFYQMILCFLDAYRRNDGSALLKGDRLYFSAQILAGGRRSALINSLMCVCLLFSLMAFLFGMVMLTSGAAVMALDSQQWMGFSQVCISIIFIIIYFSILSFQEVVECQRERGSIRILRSLGKSERQIRSLMSHGVCLRFSIPLLLFVLLLITALPLTSFKLDSQLGTSCLLVKGALLFLACFILLYALYAGIVYRMAIKGQLNGK